MVLGELPFACHVFICSRFRCPLYIFRRVIVIVYSASIKLSIRWGTT